MSDFEIVTRPDVGPRKGRWAPLISALVESVGKGDAIKTALTRREVLRVRLSLRDQHPRLRLVSRTLPDGVYLWAESRTATGGGAP